MNLTVKCSLIVLFLTIFYGCTKEQNKYSCDPQTNHWAEVNKSVFQTATRQQIATLPLDLSLAAYRTLDPQVRYDLWLEKLDIVYQQWDKPVQDMIDDLRTQLEVSWFDYTLNERDDEYLNKWENEMLTEWMDSVNYAFCFYMLSTEEEFEKKNYYPEQVDISWVNIPKELLSKDVPGGGSNSPLRCNCEWQATCVPDMSCSNSHCEQQPSGCKLLYLYPCTRMCELISGSETQR